MAYSHAVDMRHDIHVQTTEEFLLSRGMELLTVLEGKARTNGNQNKTDFNSAEGSGSVMECASLQSRNPYEGEV